MVERSRGAGSRATTVVAWSLWAITVANSVAFTWLAWLDEPTGLAGNVAGFGVVLSFVTVAAVIIWHRPRNAVGWIVLIGMVSFSASGAAQLGAQREFLSSGVAHPAAEVSAIGRVLGNMGFGTILAFLPLFFPDGRLPSRRWRPIFALALLLLAQYGLYSLIEPREMLPPHDGTGGVWNPFAVAIPEPIAAIEAPSSLLVVLVGVAATVARWRRSRGIERQQLKWFAYAVVTFVVMSSIAGLLRTRAELSVISDLANWLLLPGLGAIAITVGLAVFRYRLYDIDVVINRTLVYGVLSATLVFIYYSIVVVLTALLRPLTPSSEIVIAVSTLLIAALFQPLRTGVQRAVDQRFYRRKYHAANTIGRFSARLRQEIDLDALELELAGVVGETMQPANLSVWIRRGKG